MITRILLGVMAAALVVIACVMVFGGGGESSLRQQEREEQTNIAEYDCGLIANEGTPRFDQCVTRSIADAMQAWDLEHPELARDGS